MIFPDALAKLKDRQNLSAEETQAIFDRIFAGDVPPVDMAALLLGLREKGETVDEILGAARSMRAYMLELKAPEGALDIVGTGGDGHGTLNVSTAAAIVVAACGVPVAKHGNRASSSRSGSSDALGQLGVNLEPPWEVLEKCLHEIGLVFLFAPRHHPAMRHVVAVRRELAVRTIFNLLGPLTNPANVKRHVIGVFDAAWLEPMASVLNAFGSERAWLVHGEGLGRDGLDEISTIGPTAVMELKNRILRRFSICPEDVKLPRARLDDLKGGDASVNARAIRHLLDGDRGPYRDIVLMNAAAALVVAEKARDLAEGVFLAAEAVDTGAALQKLKLLIEMTNKSP